MAGIKGMKGSGGARTGAGRPKKIHSQLDGKTRSPLDYLLALMNDPLADPLRRDKAAIAAAAYMHAKAGEGGKKSEAQAAAARAATGRFAPGQPPKFATVTKLPIRDD